MSTVLAIVAEGAAKVSAPLETCALATTCREIKSITHNYWKENIDKEKAQWDRYLEGASRAQADLDRLLGL